MRKLASVEIIDKLEPIPNADRILKATVKGWECVVSKSDNFQQGDKVVYIEVDSVLPARPEFAFLKDRKYRIKTIKLRKQISQGLILPLSYLPNKEYAVGEDVTKILNIKKFDPQLEAENKIMAVAAPKGRFTFLWKPLMRFRWFRRLYAKFHVQNEKFPTYIASKTDEERWQNITDKLEQWRDTNVPLICTEKVDGCHSYRSSVITNKGFLPIGKIVNEKLDVEVLTYNEESKCCEFKPIIDYHKILCTKPTYRIGVGSRGRVNKPKYIECTSNHEFLTQDGWKQADELTLDDTLMHYFSVINYDIQSIILGCLLGDSSINGNRKGTSYLTVLFGHSEKQVEYFNYKKRLFGNLFIEQKDTLSGYGSVIKHGILRSNEGVRRLIEDYCLVDGKFAVTQKYCDALTPMALAFWYMDDGSLSTGTLRPKAILNTQAYDLNTVKMLVETLRNRFGLEAFIGDKEVYKGYVIYFSVESTLKFAQLIAPYVCESMRYKLPEQYRSYGCALNSVNTEVQDILPTKILSIEEFEAGHFGKHMYDLTIQDNHNYFVHSILTHNCSSTFFLDGGTFGVCSRNIWLRKEDNSPYWEIARRFQIEEALKEIQDCFGFRKIVLQGEIIGQNIQANKYKISGYDFYAFNLILDGIKVSQAKMEELLKEFRIKTVPVVYKHINVPSDLQTLNNLASGKSVLLDTQEREGIVCRNYEQGISFKAISPTFLLKEE